MPGLFTLLGQRPRPCRLESRQIRRKPVNNSVPQWLGGWWFVSNVSILRNCGNVLATKEDEESKTKVLFYHLSNDLRGEKRDWGGTELICYGGVVLASKMH